MLPVRARTPRRYFAILIAAALAGCIQDGTAARAFSLEGEEIAAWSFDRADDNRPAADQSKDAGPHHLDLEKVYNPTIVKAPRARYGEGYKLTGTQEQLRVSSQRLNIQGDLTIFLAFERSRANVGDDLLGTNVFGEEPEMNAAYQLTVMPDNQLRYFHESGQGTQADYGRNDELIDSTLTVSAGFHVLVLKRDAEKREVTAFLDQKRILHGTYDRPPTGGENQVFAVGKSLAWGIDTESMHGAVYELRIWDSVVPDSHLQRLY